MNVWVVQHWFLVLSRCTFILLSYQVIANKWWFLRQVDRKVGKNHLFKRSIILIKAWCYYESRLLGAHHGLISTYALEVLILYVFNLFHKSLHSPVEVCLKRFTYFRYIFSLYNRKAHVLPFPCVFINRFFIGFWNILASLTGTTIA